jgi:hypothetical protein
VKFNLHFILNIGAMIIIIAVTGTVVALSLYQDESTWSIIIDNLSNLTTILAILIGGWWTYLLFIRQRQDYSRAILKQDVQQIKLDEINRLLNIRIDIENVGNRLITPPKCSTTVQQVLPVPDEITQRMQNKIPLVPEGEIEVDWKVIARREFSLGEDNIDLELEPGESDQLYLDFIIPVAVTVVQVHTMIFCGDEDSEQFWDVQSLVKL